jgi:hypothetical protein
MDKVKPWVVNVIGSPDHNSEISVAREDDWQGKRGLGYISDTKLLISSGHITKVVWDKLINAANEVAIELNEIKKEGTKKGKLPSREDVGREIKYHKAFQECYYIYREGKFYSSDKKSDLVDKVLDGIRAED